MYRYHRSFMIIGFEDMTTIIIVLKTWVIDMNQSTFNNLKKYWSLLDPIIQISI